jgi:hypothetical protein
MPGNMNGETKSARLGIAFGDRG